MKDMPCDPYSGATVFHKWGEEDNLENLIKVEKEVGRHCLIVKDYLGNSIFHYAASTSSYRVCAYMVDNFQNEKFRNLDGITPAHIAAQAGDVSLLKLFTKSSVLLQVTSEMQWLPLHFAIYFNKYEAVKFLLNNNINAVDSLIIGVESSVFLPHRRLKFCSPYDLARVVGNNEIIDLLFQNGALPSLHSAVSSHCLPAITYFIESEKQFTCLLDDISATAGTKKTTALHVAAEKGFYHVCHFLLERNFPPDVIDGDGFYPLDIAVTYSSIQTVRSIALYASSSQLSSAVFLAANLNKSDMVCAVLEYVTDPSSVAPDGDSLLIRLIKRKLFVPAIRLLKKNPDLSFKDSNGATVLHYAAASDNLSLFNEIYPFAPDHNVKDNNGLTPLMYAIFTGNKSIIVQFVDSDINTFCHCGLSALGWAILLGIFSDKTTANLMLNFTKFFEFSIKNLEIRYQIDIVDFLNTLKSLNIPPIQFKTPKGTSETASYELKSGRNKERFQTIAFPHKIDEKIVVKDINILHLAALSGDQNICFQILSINKNLFSAPDSNGNTPIHYAVMCDKPKTCEEMILFSQDINEPDNNGNTFYHFIHSDAMLPVIKCLLQYTSINSQHILLLKKNNHGQTAIHTACAAGASGFLKAMIDMLADSSNILNNKVNNIISILSQIDNDGLMPIDHALKNRNLECIVQLNDAGVENLLFKAINEADIDKVGSLLKSGYPLLITDKNGNTAIHIAAEKGESEIVQLLINYGADLSRQNSAGQLPIHFAAKTNNLACIKLLLSKNCMLYPFELCSDANGQQCKRYIYCFWKRLQFLEKFLWLIHSRKQPIKDSLLSYTKLAEMNKSFDIGIKICSQLESITDIIIFQFSQRSIKTSSMGDYFQILTTISIKDLCETLSIHSTKIFLEFLANGNNSTVYAFLTLLNPLYWIESVAYLIEQASIHKLDDIDDTNVTTFSVNYMKMVSHEAHDCIVAIQANASHYISNVLKFKLYPNYIMMYFIDAKIKQLIARPNHVFHSQALSSYQLFFGNNFYLPRNLPFKYGKCIVAFCHDFLIISQDDKSVTIPHQFLHVYNETGKNATIMRVYTPVGSLSLKCRPTDGAQLINLIDSRKIEILGNFSGFSSFQSDKKRPFKCLVAYSEENSIDFKGLTINIKLMVVNAETKECCFDICRDQLVDQVGCVPTFVGVQAKDVSDDINELIVI